jgi:hypothetical protein
LGSCLPTMNAGFCRGCAPDPRDFAVVLQELWSTGHFSNRHMPLDWQASIVLYYLGHSGTGACVGELARRFGLSEGGVVKLGNIVLRAFEELMPRWIYWPDEAEKATLVIRFYRLMGIRGTWGPIADGTDAYFAWKPLLRGDSWVGRKGRCGFNHLKVVDSTI